MSYEEKNTWSLGIIAVLGYAAYLVMAFLVGDGPLDPDTYMWPMVWAIGGGIVAGIVAGILIGMASGGSMRRGATMIDRRDREIGWAGSRVGNSLIVIGGIGALILCFVDAPHVLIANTLYLGFVLAAILETTTKIVIYRRGF
ncbi:MAG: hypothetical protein DI577_08445 [Microbacterium sp.]|nr:MAG: hypothetical protein DI577_08445 [Microbacterium sp.]PZU34477.1 MAG: hypothetical protein DI575_08445 [Microbacterium sp.]